MDERCFFNDFENVDTTGFTVPASLVTTIQASLSSSLVYLTNPSSYAALLGLSAAACSPADDGTVYTGTGGLALLFLRLGDLDKAGTLAREALQTASSSKPTFLTGFPGPLALLAVVESRRGRSVSLAPLLALAPQAVALSSPLPDELLYGRAGYLYTLLYLRKELGQDSVPSPTVRMVVDAVVQSGRMLAQQVRQAD